MVTDKHPDYFEAIIQIRNPNQEVQNFIANAVKKRDDVFIARVEKTKNGGLDYYISSQRYARAIGNRLKKSFNGTLKMTRSIFTRNHMTSKDVYRVTVLFKLD